MNNIDYTALAEKIIINLIQISNDHDKSKLISDLTESNTFKCKYYYERVGNATTVLIYNEKYVEGCRKFYWDRRYCYVWFVSEGYRSGLSRDDYKSLDNFKINICNILELACFI